MLTRPEQPRLLTRIVLVTSVDGWVGVGLGTYYTATAGSEAAPAQQLEPEPRPGSIRKKSGSKSLADP